MGKLDTLRAELEKARELLHKRGLSYDGNANTSDELMRAKPFEIAYQDVIEKIWPDDAWWQVTGYWDIFDAMMGGLDDGAVIDEIIKHVGPDYIDECKEACIRGARVEKGHNMREYLEKFGDEYDEGKLWDHLKEDFEEGRVDARKDIVYWYMEDLNGEWRYFETSTLNEAKEEKKLDEGTPNFPVRSEFPLLVFYTYDEFVNNMKSDPDYPDEDDFTEEDEVDGHEYINWDAYDTAKDEFEEKYFDDNKICVLDEDAQEQLENKLHDFNIETERMANDIYDSEIDDYDNDDYYALKDIKLGIESGYYSGAYIDVDNEEQFGYMGEELAKQQKERVNNFLAEIQKEFGLTKLGVAWGPASNGETGYSIINDSLKEEDKPICHNCGAELGTEKYTNPKTGEVLCADCYARLDDEDEEQDESLNEKKHDGNCPFCGSENIDFVDSDEDSEKHICRDCGKDFIVHSDDEVTDRHNRPIKEDNEVARVEYCIMDKDNNNIECFDDSDKAIAWAKDNGGARVLEVKYGPKNEHGDEPELSAEAVWAVEESLDESMKSEVTKWWKDVEDANREMKWEFNIDNGDYSDEEAMHAAMFDMLDDLKEKGAFELFKRGKELYNKYAKYSKYNEDLNEDKVVTPYKFVKVAKPGMKVKVHSFEGDFDGEVKEIKDDKVIVLDKDNKEHRFSKDDTGGDFEILEDVEELDEKKSKKKYKVRYTGDPAKDAAFFNHAMGSDKGGDVSVEQSSVSLGEGYIGQEVDDFLGVINDNETIETLVISNIDADDYTEAFKGKYDDLDSNLLHCEYADFDVGGDVLVVNVKGYDSDDWNDLYYDTLESLLEDYNGDEVKIIDFDTGETIFEGDKEEIDDDTKELTFWSIEAPKYLCINAHCGEVENYDEEEPEDDGLKIEYWYDEESRDQGLGDYYFGDIEDVEDGKELVRKMIDRDGFASAELQRGDKVLFGYDGESTWGDENESLDEASHRGMAYYAYKGCHVRETPSCFVATDEHGTTLGDSKTKAGAEALIDDHVEKKDEKLSKKKIEKKDEDLTEDEDLYALHVKVLDSNTGKINKIERLFVGSKQECDTKKKQLEDASPEDSHHNKNVYKVSKVK